MAEILQGGPRDTINSDSGGAITTYAVTNVTQSRTLNCDANSDLATADVLGTLIRDLIRSGILNGTVA